MRKTSFITVSLFIFALFGNASISLADGYEPEPEPALREKTALSQPAETADAGIQSAEPSIPTLEKASGDDLAAAIGHYAKARSLLMAATNEFDMGYKLARPDALLDSKEWRRNVISRAEDLEKVLAPQPRITNSGVRFQGDARLLKKGK